MPQRLKKQSDKADREPDDFSRASVIVLKLRRAIICNAVAFEFELIIESARPRFGDGAEQMLVQATVIAALAVALFALYAPRSGSADKISMGYVPVTRRRANVDICRGTAKSTGLHWQRY